MFYQYFLPYLAMCSFFYLSESCFNDFFVVLSRSFFLSSLLFIHKIKKSTTRTGSTLKSLFKSTFCTYSSTEGTTISTAFSAFFYSPLLFFFIAFYYYYLASCYLLSFSYRILCLSFSLTYLQLFAISLMKMFNS